MADLPQFDRKMSDAEGLMWRLEKDPHLSSTFAAVTILDRPPDFDRLLARMERAVHVVDDTEREWILVSAYARRARAGWAIGEAELWDDRGRLLAFATQSMYVRTITGEMPVRDATDPR